MRNRNKSGNVSGGGIGATGLLGVAFVVLKLCGVIGWSWLWVLSPFWIPLAALTVYVIILACIK